MAQLPKYLIIQDKSLFLVSLSYHNFETVLKEEWAKHFYYELLLRFKDDYGVKFFGYVFTENQPMLAGQVAKKEGLSEMMRKVSGRFGQRYNRENSRSGQVSMGKYQAKAIQNEDYLLKIIKDMDMHPVKCAIAKHPSKYKWSSYRRYAFGKEDPLITPFPKYKLMGKTEEERQKNYRKIILSPSGQFPVESKGHPAYFIGDTDWVKERCEPLREWARQKRLLYKTRALIDSPEISIISVEKEPKQYIEISA